MIQEILPSQPPQSTDEELPVQFRKFTSPTQKSEMVEVAFSCNPGLLLQYYQLRARMFISVWGLKDFHGAEDEFDSRSHIAIARKGNLCVGGGRLSVSSPAQRVELPMEKDDFSLVSALPQLKLANKTYAEISSIAVMPDFRSEELMKDFWQLFTRQIVAQQVQYAFWIAPSMRSREYSAMAKTLGITATVQGEVTIPDREEFDGVPMQLGMLDFTKFSGLEAKSTSVAQKTDA